MSSTCFVVVDGRGAVIGHGMTEDEAWSDASDGIEDRGGEKPDDLHLDSYDSDTHHIGWVVDDADGELYLVVAPGPPPKEYP